MSDKLLSEAKKMDEKIRYRCKCGWEAEYAVRATSVWCHGCENKMGPAYQVEYVEAAPSARAAQGEASLVQKLIEVCQRLRRGCDCIHDDRCANCDRIIEAQELAQQLQAAPPAQGKESYSDYLRNYGKWFWPSDKNRHAEIADHIESLTARVEELESIVEAQNDPDSVGNPAWLARRMQERGDAAEAESAQLREQVKGLTKLHELAKEIREQGVDEYWKTLPDEMAILTKFDEASAALSATEREVAG